MLNQAVQKLQDEIQKNKDNPAIKVVGECLIGHLKQNPQDAEKIMQDKKTIAGAMDDMKKHAQKKQKNGYAVITPDEGFKMVMDYFGVKAAAPVGGRDTPPALSKKIERTQGDGFNIDLDALL